MYAKPISINSTCRRVVYCIVILVKLVGRVLADGARFLLILGCQLSDSIYLSARRVHTFSFFRWDRGGGVFSCLCLRVSVSLRSLRSLVIFYIYVLNTGICVSCEITVCVAHIHETRPSYTAHSAAWRRWRTGGTGEV